jgi:hypothetical protein
MSTELPNPESPKPVKSVEIHQQKANFFRVIHADGVWCSMNTHKQIHMTFYNERYPIPTKIFLGLNEQGFPIREELEKRETKKDWFREMEVDVVLTLEAARQVHTNLGQFIQLAEKAFS